MESNQQLDNFNPNDPGSPDSNIFGLPFDSSTANLVIIPVPWDVTVSYSKGTAKGPKAIFDASFQVDLYDPLIKDAWRLGIAMDDIDLNIWKKSKTLRKEVEIYLDFLLSGKDPNKSKSMSTILETINKGCSWLHKEVEKKALHYLNKGKSVALIGGDHSTPLGLMKALSKKYENFGILQIDAHADLRNAYEGFTYSHASIMYNALQIPSIKQLVQIGVRDYCEEEVNLIQNDARIHTFYDKSIKHQQYKGSSWEEICREIITKLPQHVYISFDIDGLDPKYCPNTGTPVPGGLEFEQTLFLFEELVKSGKKIIGFDINEVAPSKKDEWDANVGARLLYRMANIMFLSQG
ncbi:MAG: agmatinase family protein [Saprospiraceae bacterium]